MPPAAGQQQQNDTSLGPFWIIAGLFLLAWGIWYFAHEQISWAILKLRLFEAHLISPVIFIKSNKWKETDRTKQLESNRSNQTDRIKQIE